MKTRPYINPYVGGVLLGLTLFAAFYLTGAGLGASSAVNRVQVAVLDNVAPKAVDKMAYCAQLAGGDKNPLDSPSVMMLLGTLVGGMVAGVLSGRFKPEVRKGAGVSNGTRLALALLGGLIMGFGARFSRGCTSGQALSGGAVLSAGSWLFMFSVFGGAYGLAWFLRRFWRVEEEAV
ncbi:MAG: YeeE/YedE family protein [Kiritimatiellae bacterium]|nr:YeeE/YedE family protein [Kiritimatiellia bacterium]